MLSSSIVAELILGPSHGVANDYDFKKYSLTYEQETCPQYSVSFTNPLLPIG